MPSDFLEKTLEDIIFENRASIHNHGLPRFRKTVFRQFILPSGKKLDIFSYDLNDGHIVIDIYELKRYDINTDAICQAYNYFMEVTQFIAGKFKSIDIHIIMIGRYYTPVIIFEKINLPFSVYTYDYQLSGMSFQKHQERRQLKTPNDDFSLGLWAFGSGELYYPKGQPDTVNLANVYSSWKTSNKDSHFKIQGLTGNLFLEPIIKTIESTTVKYIEPKEVKTEIFTIQPSWTPGFAKLIPDDELMLDLEFDDSDLESEPLEADYSDFEPDIEEDDIQRVQWPTLIELEDELNAMIDSIRQEPDLVINIPLDDPEIKKADEFINKVLKRTA